MTPGYITDCPIVIFRKGVELLYETGPKCTGREHSVGKMTSSTEITNLACESFFFFFYRICARALCPGVQVFDRHIKKNRSTY